MCIHRSGQETCSVYTQEWPRDMHCVYIGVAKRHAVYINKSFQEACSGYTQECPRGGGTGVVRRGGGGVVR
jgi:hypothetical protein